MGKLICVICGIAIAIIVSNFKGCGVGIGNGDGDGDGHESNTNKVTATSEEKTAVLNKIYTLKDKAIYDENENEISLADFAKQKEDILKETIIVNIKPTADGSHVKLLKKWKTEESK